MSTPSWIRRLSVASDDQSEFGLPSVSLRTSTLSGSRESLESSRYSSSVYGMSDSQTYTSGSVPRVRLDKCVDRGRYQNHPSGDRDRDRDRTRSRSRDIELRDRGPGGRSPARDYRSETDSDISRGRLDPRDRVRGNEKTRSLPEPDGRTPKDKRSAASLESGSKSSDRSGDRYVKKGQKLAAKREDSWSFVDKDGYSEISVSLILLCVLYLVCLFNIFNRYIYIYITKYFVVIRQTIKTHPVLLYKRNT